MQIGRGRQDSGVQMSLLSFSHKFIKQYRDYQTQCWRADSTRHSTFDEDITMERATNHTTMSKRQLGQLQVSAQGLGCMGMSFGYGGSDEATALRTLHAARD